MIRLFIADDHAIVRDGLKRILADEQDMVVVGEASDGREALRLLQRCQWDLLLLDVSMPQMGGLEVLVRIHINHPDKYVLVLTQYEEPHLALRFMKAGTHGYLTKLEAATDIAE